MIKIYDRKQFGITIIELMIAMVLGLMLTAGISNVYLTTKNSYRLTENLSRLQESARFGMSMLTQDIRMAGFIPCRLGGNVNNTLDSTNSLLDFFNGSIVGYEGGVSTFPTDLPAVGTSSGDRVAGTDAVVILRGGDETYKINNHVPTSATFFLNDLHTLGDGDIALVCDGENAAILQLTNVQSTNITIVHNTGTATPGNCSKSLGGNGCDCSDTTCFEDHAFGPGSQLVKFEAMAYYIGISSYGDSRSLYRRRLDIDNATKSIAFQAEELLEGIESMQILYGEDTDSDTQAERYLTANNVTTWNDVISVRLGLLVHSPDQTNAVNDTNTYVVAGTPIADTVTAITHDGDRRLRYSFTSTVKMRNRGLN